MNDEAKRYDPGKQIVDEKITFLGYFFIIPLQKK